MSASSTDLFKKAARKWVGQVGAGGVSDSSVATIPLSSATGLPTDTAVEIVIDRVDSSGTKTPALEETIVGVVSGSNLVTCTRGVEGTAQAHLAGAVVEVLITADMWNDVIDGFVVEHSQAGVHSNALVTTLKASASEVTAGVSDLKIVTPKALKDANIVAVTALSKATGVEVNAGSDDAKYTTPKAIKDANVLTTSYSPASGTQTLDLALGNTFIVTLPATNQITLAIQNATIGQWFNVQINNVTSQASPVWFTTIRWQGGTAGTVCGTNGKRDSFVFYVSGSNTYDGYIAGLNA